jgi:hypothetical protein
MDDHGALDSRGWSSLRKALVTTTTTSFPMTCAGRALDVLPLKLPRRRSADAFNIGTFLELPAGWLANLPGLKSKVGRFGLLLLEIVTNTTLAFGLGTFLGLLVWIPSHAFNWRRQ